MLNNSLLRTKTKPFDFSKENAQEVFETLRRELIEKGNGLGLSANQIGLNTSAIIFGNSEDPSSIEPMFNPKIVYRSDYTFPMEEGCLSFPGLHGKVDRSMEIRVRFASLTGEVKTATFNGMTARIIQHETDHLQGVLFFDKFGETKLRRMIDKARKNGYNYVYNELRLIKNEDEQAKD